MANELQLTNAQLVALIEQGGITDVIRPLVREIHLFDTYVAGTSYVDRAVLEGLAAGDKLILRLEKDNKFDDKAILLLTEAQAKVGYVPEKDNAVFYRLMDAGKLLTAQITKIDWKGDFCRVAIAINLVDF